MYREACPYSETASAVKLCFRLPPDGMRCGVMGRSKRAIVVHAARWDCERSTQHVIAKSKRPSASRNSQIW